MKTRCAECGKEGEVPLPFADYSIRSLCGACVHNSPEQKEINQDDPPIMMPPFCPRHQHEIVHEAGYKETDPWRVLMVAAQIAMFQGATSTPSVHKRLGGDVSKIGTLGCFACRLPNKWGQVIAAAKISLATVKALGDGWIEEANKNGGV
jgi:hypothetical protein